MGGRSQLIVNAILLGPVQEPASAGAGFTPCVTVLCLPIYRPFHVPDNVIKSKGLVGGKLS